MRSAPGGRALPSVKNKRRRKSQKAKGEPRAPALGPRLPAWAVWLIVATGSAAISIYAMEANTRAQWDVMDDHQILHYLGPDGTMTLGELPRFLAGTEVGEWGRRNQRFRPSYYTLRLLEAWLWGDVPGRWYLARIVMLAVSVALFWRVLARWIGLPGAGVAMLYCLWLPFWGGVWCRLGPGETYCVPALGLYVFGAVGILRAARAPSPVRPARAVGYWAALTAGALIAMGAKENFLLLIPPTWALTAWLIRKRRLGAVGAGFAAAISAYGLFLIVVIATAIGRSGHDVYAREVSASSRLPLIGAGFVQAFARANWRDAAAVAGLGAGLLLLRRHIRELLPSLARTAAILVGLLLLYGSQFVFYNGEWPGKTPRYDFPGALARPCYWVALGALGLEFLRVKGVRPTARHLLCAVAAGAMVVPALWRTPYPLRESSRKNVARTHMVTQFVMDVAKILKQEPGRPLVLLSHARKDAETSVAILRSLRALGVANPLFLKVDWDKDAPDRTREEQHAFEIMTARSRKGMDGFRPLGELPAAPRPFAVGLSGPPVGPYAAIGRFW